MTIIEALKTENIRISDGNRWMFWDTFLPGWVVLERKYNAKKNTILIETDNEEEAIKYLLGEDL